MCATEVLQKCLEDALGSMHALRSRVLLRAVEATIHGRRLTLIDLSRSWPGAERIRAPLKALDRLLGNRHLHAEHQSIHAAMARWLVRSKQPVIVVDWSELKQDRSWHLLRAAIPVGGRTLPILDMVFPAGKQGSPTAEKQFLQRLADVLPEGVVPVLVTDAGFRGPWFRAVEAMGWRWLGRLRNTTYLKPSDDSSPWASCKSMYTLAKRAPRDCGLMDVARSVPLTARVVLHAKPSQGRKHHNQLGCTSTQLVQSTARSARAGTLVVDSVTESEAQRTSIRRSIRTTHADRTVVSRPKVPSLRASLRGQPHTQGLAHRGTAPAQHLGGVRHMAGRHGLRSEWHRPLVDAVPVETAALLDHASGVRGTGATMVECARG